LCQLRNLLFQLHHPLLATYESSCGRVRGRIRGPCCCANLAICCIWSCTYSAADASSCFCNCANKSSTVHELTHELGASPPSLPLIHICVYEGNRLPIDRARGREGWGARGREGWGRRRGFVSSDYVSKNKVQTATQMCVFSCVCVRERERGLFKEFEEFSFCAVITS